MENEPEYQPIPGRGLNSKKSIQERRDFLISKGHDISDISKPHLNASHVQNNIESYIGTIEIPVGTVGPLFLKKADMTEPLYGVVGTMEGALVASMNRGAKAVSKSGGFMVLSIDQHMVRSPLFLCSDGNTVNKLSQWVHKHQKEIQNVAESYSNHARLNRIEHIINDDNLHLRFFYETGDASGQNMTTVCTWHAVLYIVEQFKNETGIEIADFVLEGNAASDKKVSQFLMDDDGGRGIRIKVECELPEEIIKKVLRTTTHQMLKFYYPSRNQAQRDGMLGYNINVANTIAGFFTSTGQDLASIHESSLADLHLEPIGTGLKVSLTLHSLVIGTVGGGTGLPSQKAILKIMDCKGSDKVSRLATIIAGFALSLELSTFAAMVSGQFAKAHERLGRNKPTAWLTRSELNDKLIRSFIRIEPKDAIQKIKIHPAEVEHGILMNLTRRCTRKFIGFIPIDVRLNTGKTESLLMKSKAVDHEVVKGLHHLSAAIDPELADLLAEHWTNLEYKNCHVKELKINDWLSENLTAHIPRFYGYLEDQEREIFVMISERIDPTQMRSMDSENRPWEWTPNHISRTIEAIHNIHCAYTPEMIPEVAEFDPVKAMPLYIKLVRIIQEEYMDQDYQILDSWLEDMLTDQPDYQKTMVHNDFNPRNVALRENGTPCIYDFELAMINYPQRDIIEFLSFVLPDNFEPEIFMNYINAHHQVLNEQYKAIDIALHYNISIRMLKEFLITRLTFYKAASILLQLKFIDRVISNVQRMITILESKLQTTR